MTSSFYQILLALADEARHGYAIMREIEVRTDGAEVVGAATLYRSLAKMLEAGLIRELEGETGDGDERRRLYEMTASGRDALRDEAGRLQRLAGYAVRKGLFEA